METTSIQAMDLGLLLARVVIGTVMAAHGAQKLLGWFGGYGLDGTGQFFDQLGFRPGRMFAALASATEITSGLLVALGALGPIGPALMTSVMIVAMITVHWSHGLFAQDNGIEVPLLYMTGAVALAFTGFGRFSLDALLGIAGVWTPELSALVVAAGIMGGIGNVLLRRPPTQAAR